MKTSFKTRAALWLAAWINARADELRGELRDRVQDETRRIALADRRVRGLRLYAAWSGARCGLPEQAAATLTSLPATV